MQTLYICRLSSKASDSWCLRVHHVSEPLDARCRVDGNSGDTQGAYFHAHRNQDGMWATAAAMPRCREGSGRPAAYVALNGEAQLAERNTWSMWICRNPPWLPCCARLLLQRTSSAAKLASGLLRRSVGVQKPSWYTSVNSAVSSAHAGGAHNCLPQRGRQSVGHGWVCPHRGPK